mgnify:CR=1 FL=1
MTSDWEHQENFLVKEFKFSNFKEALLFANKVGDIAESLNHHPNIFLHDYKCVIISTSTHSEGKITAKDHVLAQKINKIAITSTHQRGYTHLLLLIVLFIMTGLTISSRFISPQKNSQNPNLQLSGSEVLQIIDGQKTVLFKNVEGVSEIRRGPDGKTIHFKSDDTTNPLRNYCVYIKKTTIPSSQPPWDFKQMKDIPNISGCYDGYTTHSNYFAYLQIKNDKEGYIVYENLGTGKTNKILIDPNILPGFEYTRFGNSYMDDDLIIGNDNYPYHYASRDAKISNALILIFGNLVTAIDVTNNHFMGSQFFDGKEFQVVSDSFELLNENSLPFIVVESQWEGPPVLTALIDLTDNNFKVIKLVDLDNRPFADFNVEPIIWEKNTILFSFHDFENIKIPNKFDVNVITSTDAEIKYWSRQLESILSNPGSYQQVKCGLHYGPLGCEGLKGIKQYRYSSEHGLTKI